MEKGFESWFRDQQIDWQSPDPNSLCLRPRLTVPEYSGNMLSPNRNHPVFAFSAHQPHEASVPEEPRGWFYGLPRYRQGFIPGVVNSNPRKEQAPVVSPNKDRNGAEATNGVQKKFLVFDQSGDQTTLIYRSGVGAAPIQYHIPSWNPPKLPSPFDVKKVNTFLKKDKDIHCSYPFHVDESTDMNDGDNVRSETREDTEELNALLYSDDEIDSSENEETSTGHSPSTMTGFQRQEWPNESTEEEDVASSGEPGKRKRKVENGVCNANSLEDTANSGQSGVNSPNDAELGYCGGGNLTFEDESNTTNKRSRKEKVHETITLLRNLIPGSKNGKDAMTVIDEAIDYLSSLKDKAKALGLDSL